MDTHHTPALGAGVSALFRNRWLLLVLAEAARGTARFGEFEERLDIPPPTLAKCLKWLVECELLALRVYRRRPLRQEYVLAEGAASIGPLLAALSAWGERHIVNAQPQRRDTGLRC